MKIDFYKQNGEKDKTVDYPKSLQYSISDDRILAYIKYLQNITRDSISDSKDRSEVRGGGRKPWKQKGTGRARHGSRRSPIWSGGGITFGPSKNRNFSTGLNKSEKRVAILSIISRFAENKKVLGLSEFDLPEPKTKKINEMIQKLPVKGKFSVVLSSGNDNLAKSFRNLPACVAVMKNSLDILKVVSGDMLIFTDKSFENFSESYSKSKKTAIIGSGGKDAK